MRSGRVLEGDHRDLGVHGLENDGGKGILTRGQEEDVGRLLVKFGILDQAGEDESLAHTGNLEPPLDLGDQVLVTEVAYPKGHRSRIAAENLDTYVCEPIDPLAKVSVADAQNDPASDGRWCRSWTTSTGGVALSSRGVRLR